MEFLPLPSTAALDMRPDGAPAGATPGRPPADAAEIGAFIATLLPQLMRAVEATGEPLEPPEAPAAASESGASLPLLRPSLAAAVPIASVLAGGSTAPSTGEALEAAMTPGRPDALALAASHAERIAAGAGYGQAGSADARGPAARADRAVPSFGPAQPTSSVGDADGPAIERPDVARADAPLATTGAPRGIEASAPAALLKSAERLVSADARTSPASPGAPDALALQSADDAVVVERGAQHARLALSPHGPGAGVTPVRMKGDEAGVQLAAVSSGGGAGAESTATDPLIKPVEPLKLADAYVTRSSALPVTEPDVFAQRLSRDVVVMVSHGAQQARLTVNPPELGPVEVRIRVSGDEATVQLVAAHAATREALEDALPRLRSAFADSGIALGDASVFAQMPERQGADAAATADAGSEYGTPTDDVLAQPPASVRIRIGLVDEFA